MILFDIYIIYRDNINDCAGKDKASDGLSHYVRYARHNIIGHSFMLPFFIVSISTKITSRIKHQLKGIVKQR